MATVNEIRYHFHMAKLKTGRHTSAIKQFRKSERRNQHNNWIRKKIRSIAKKVEAAILKKDSAEAKKLLAECFSAWDKAAKVGVVHKNSASRKKARLSVRVAQISA